MTERQNRFVEYYLQSGNASESARRAGYSKKSAYAIGEENLRKPEIRAAIDKRLVEMDSARRAKTEEILEFLTAVVRGEIKETVITQSGKKFVVPVKASDRLAAAEKLLRVYGAYREKIDVKVDSASLFVETLQKVWSGTMSNE